MKVKERNRRFADYDQVENCVNVPHYMKGVTLLIQSTLQRLSTVGRILLPNLNVRRAFRNS